MAILMKYIVETIGMFRQIHVVEADNEESAFEIAEVADDNWQEFLGVTKLDINEYTEEQIALFRKKEFFWEGISYKDENGMIQYKRPKAKF
jgi:hypothetical protein